MQDKTNKVAPFVEAELLPAEIENDKNIDLLSDEQDVDDELVNKAVTQIKDLFFSHYTNAMLEVGRYLIKEFYNDDLELVKLNKVVKGKSLLSVIKKLNVKGENNPSQSWIYNSIKLVVDNKALSDFDSYRNLSLSTKVLISKVKDEETKKELSEEAYKKNLTVSQLREVINKKKGIQGTGLLRFIKNAESIKKCDINKTFSESILSDLSKKKLITVKTTVKNRITALETIIKAKTDTLNKYKKVKEHIDTVTKESKSKSK